MKNAIEKARAEVALCEAESRRPSRHPDPEVRRKLDGWTRIALSEARRELARLQAAKCQAESRRAVAAYFGGK